MILIFDIIVIFFYLQMPPKDKKQASKDWKQRQKEKSDEYAKNHAQKERDRREWQQKHETEMRGNKKFSQIFFSTNQK